MRAYTTARTPVSAGNRSTTDRCLSVHLFGVFAYPSLPVAVGVAAKTSLAGVHARRVVAQAGVAPATLCVPVSAARESRDDPDDNVRSDSSDDGGTEDIHVAPLAWASRSVDYTKIAHTPQVVKWSDREKPKLVGNRQVRSHAGRPVNLTSPLHAPILPHPHPPKSSDLLSTARRGQKPLENGH